MTLIQSLRNTGNNFQEVIKELVGICVAVIFPTHVGKVLDGHNFQEAGIRCKTVIEHRQNLTTGDEFLNDQILSALAFNSIVEPVISFTEFQ